jgi:predicted transcriptional regulator
MERYRILFYLVQIKARSIELRSSDELEFTTSSPIKSLKRLTTLYLVRKDEYMYICVVLQGSVFRIYAWEIWTIHTVHVVVRTDL